MDKLIKDVHALLGIRLSPKQVSAFQLYERELLEWNKKYNLTAIREPEGIRTKHFLDSLTCLLAWRERPPQTMIDIGTGAGFPGIPLKIICPRIKLTLVDSVGKKLDFCRHLAGLLEMKEIFYIQGRAEEIGLHKDHREQYDWAAARAVANMPVLVEYLVPLVKVGGAILAQKGASGPHETQKAQKAIQLLGGHLHQIIPVLLPGVVEERYLIVVNKISATPPGYPRRVGLPAKRPIS